MVVNDYSCVDIHKLSNLNYPFNLTLDCKNYFIGIKRDILLDNGVDRFFTVEYVGITLVIDESTGYFNGNSLRTLNSNDDTSMSCKWLETDESKTMETYCLETLNVPLSYKVVGKTSTKPEYCIDGTYFHGAALNMLLSWINFQELKDE